MRYKWSECGSLPITRVYVVLLAVLAPTVGAFVQHTVVPIACRPANKHWSAAPGGGTRALTRAAAKRSGFTGIRAALGVKGEGNAMSAKDIPGLEELLSQDEIDESFSNYDWKPWGELELSGMSEAFRKSSLPSNARPGAVPRVSVPTKVPMCRSTQRPESQPPLPMPRVACGLLWVHTRARQF